MKTRITAFLSAVCLCVAGAVSCVQRGTEYYIGVSQCSDDEWRMQMNREILREANFAGKVRVEIHTADDSSERQRDDIEYFIERGVDLLVVAPNEAGPVTSAVEEAFDRGIPVVVVDRKVHTDRYTAYVGADNYEIGRSAGEYIASSLHGKGTVAEITGLAGSTPAIERHRGFMDAISAYPGIRLVAEAGGNWQREHAVEKMDSLLSAVGPVDYVYAHNDRMASGAYDAALRRGLADRIRFVGTDALSGGVEDILAGNMDATFIYPTGGDSVIELALDILSGRPYSRETLLKTSLVDSANANVMMMQMANIAALDAKIDALNGKVGMYQIRYANQRIVLLCGLIVLFLLIGLLVAVLLALMTKNRLNRELAAKQAQLEMQQDQLKQLYAELEETANAKQVFFTSISHDFRTPLTLIADPVEQLLEDKAIEGPSRYMLETVKKNVSVLLGLVNQILDFRKVESGKMEFSPEPFDLLSGISAWSDAFRPSMRKKGMTFTLDADSCKDYGTMVDVGKMERIFFNLMSNAVKYTPDGGTVKVSLGRSGEEFSLSVFNSGSYIAPEDAEAIFERFYQLHGHKAGTGIGLALVHSFVEMHGGRIEVHSDDVGTTFTVYLPHRDTGSVPVAGMAMPEEKTVAERRCPDGDSLVDGSGTDESMPTVLVIDDNEDIRQYVKSLLSAKYRVLEASDGASGLRLAIKYVPDIVISDVVMPVMDGVECCRRIKGELQTCHIPVILLTACSLDEQRIQGYDGGADSYISKPFSSKLLISRIDNLLENRMRMKSVFSDGVSVEKEKVCDLDREFITKFRALLEDRMQDSELSVEDLGRDMGMSRVQLYRKLKSLTNYSPNELLRHIRLRKAASLLSTGLTVAEVAYQVGFSSPSYFSKCYREEFGESPTDFLKRSGRKSSAE